MLNKLWKISLVLFIFFLPWQTRWIYSPAYLNGYFWEYGSAFWYGTEILLWLTIIFFALDTFRAKKISHIFSSLHWRSHRRDLFFALAFLGFLALGVLHSIRISLSYDHVFWILEGVCLLTILASISNKRLLLYSFWWSAVLQGLFGALQFFTQNISANKWLGLAAQSSGELGTFVVESGGERWLRAYGSFGSPNILGGFLAVALIIGLILYIHSRPVQKIYLTFGQSIILIGLILSFSRSAWLGAVVGWLIVGIQILIQKNKGISGYHVMGIYGKQSIFYLIIFASLLTLFKPLFFTRFDAANRLENRSLTERASQYLEAKNIIQKKPLLGVGPGAYTLALYQKNVGQPAYFYQPVHNSYVLIMAEWGIIGFLIWLVIIAWLLSRVRLFNPEFLPVIFTMLLAASFDHFWWSLYIGVVLWWVIFGLSISSKKLENADN